MKILLSLLVIISVVLVIFTFSINIKKHKYLLFFIPVTIIGFANLRFLFNDLLTFLVCFNVFVFFVGTILLISMFKFTSFKFAYTKELSKKVYDLIQVRYWIRPIVCVGYFIIQMLIIWQGGDFIFIK